MECELVVFNRPRVGRQRSMVMRERVAYIIFAVMVALLYIHNSVMGADRELNALDRVRNSSGYLIKYEQAN